jgi:hypothetical protein
VNPHSYINDGTIEAYVLGLMTPVEKNGFEQLVLQYPELQLALADTQRKLEALAANEAVPPPPGAQEHLYEFIKGLPALRTDNREVPPFTETKQTKQYITAEVSSTHIRVHKYWRLAFLVVFILSKVFLGFLIYYIIKFHEAKAEMKELQHQQQEQTTKPPVNTLSK